MKKLINRSSKFLVMSFLAWGVLGCSDFLDLKPLDVRVEDNFYRTESDATEALTSVYDVLQWNTVQGFHPTPMLLDIASDDAFAGGGSRSDAPNIIEIDQDNIRPTNVEIEGLWKKHFIGIARANLILARIDGIEASENFKKSVIAQTKFLRAHFYLDLVRFYGNVPLILEPQNNPNEYCQPQVAPKLVYDQIARDLEEAIVDLPAQTIQASQGRATRWAAKALLARAYLFYKGVYGQEMQTGSVTVDAPRALNHLKDVINNSGHDLVANYGEIFRRTGEFNRESVWEISYSDLNPWFDWGYIQGGEGNIQAQMQGARISNPAAEDYLAGWSFAPVTHDLYTAFEEGDPRREATIIVETEYKEGFDKGYQHTGYFSKKYSTSKDYAPAAGQPELNWGNNYRSIRFSDVLLMAAELDLMTGGGTDAANFLNRVRARVGLPAKVATMDNIFQERRVELALEGHRYWDLMRRGVSTAATRINASNTLGPLYTGDEVDFANRFNPARLGFFPIPQSDMDLCAGTLKQNAGY